LIIKCPSCKKPASDKAEACTNCGFELSENSLASFREQERRSLRDRIYRLKMSSYAAITLLLAGAGWYFYETADLELTPSLGPIVLVALGSIAYVAVRILLFTNKRSLRNL
jgi:hypothetical protein